MWRHVGVLLNTTDDSEDQTQTNTTVGERMFLVKTVIKLLKCFKLKLKLDLVRTAGRLCDALNFVGWTKVDLTFVASAWLKTKFITLSVPFSSCSWGLGMCTEPTVLSTIWSGCSRSLIDAVLTQCCRDHVGSRAITWIIMHVREHTYSQHTHYVGLIFHSAR